MRRSILPWELGGIAFIIVVGSVLHFAFEWSGRAIAIAPIGAVNESVWEHLKLGFWPALIYAAFEYRCFGKSVDNFPAAKTIGIYLIPLTIAVLYYAYTAILGHGLVQIDIAVFVVAVALGQMVSYKLLIASPLSARLNRFAPIALAILSALFVLLVSIRRNCRPSEIPLAEAMALWDSAEKCTSLTRGSTQHTGHVSYRQDECCY